MSVTWERTREPGIYKRAGTRGTHYRVMTRDATGRQVVRNFDRFEDAREHRRTATGEDRPGDSLGARRTLREVYEAQHGARSYARKTLALHRSAWAHLAGLHDRPIGKITPSDIDVALGRLDEKPVMRERTRAMLSTLFNFAIARRWIKTNPVTRPRVKRTRAEMLETRSAGADRPRHLSNDELARLLEAMPERHRALIELMARMGLRPGEAYALTVDKLTPATEVPKRRPATLRIDTSVTGFTKTGEIRTLALPTTIAEMLAEHIARFVGPDGTIFTTESGTPIDPDNFRRRVWATACRTAGISGLSPNALRHTAASFAIASNANVYDVQRMLGHRTASVTLDVYGGLFEEEYERFVERYDEAIRKARTTHPHI